MDLISERCGAFLDLPVKYVACHASMTMHGARKTKMLEMMIFSKHVIGSLYR